MRSCSRREQDQECQILGDAVKVVRLVSGNEDDGAGGHGHILLVDADDARAFAHGSSAAGVGRIVYLGGLYPEGEDLSPHLDSRREVGEILLDSGVPTAVLRAAVIIGSGSASFEMLRYITERLPVMVTPR